MRSGVRSAGPAGVAAPGAASGRESHRPWRPTVDRGRGRSCGATRSTGEDKENDMEFARMFLSPRHAADWLGLSPRTLERYRRTGEGPVFYRFGRHVRYLQADLEAWAKTRRRTSTRDEGNARRAVARWHDRRSSRRASVASETDFGATQPVCINASIRSATRCAGPRSCSTVQSAA